MKQNGDENNNSLRGRLESIQMEFDSTLMELSEEVDTWNLKLEHASRSSGGSHTNKLRQLAQEALNNLDAKWPFFHDEIHVSGKWYVPQISLSHSQFNFAMQKAEAFNIVRSNGFQVFEAQEDTPRIGLSFIVSDLPIYSAAVQGNFSILSFADLKDVSLLYIRPNETESLQPDMSDLAERMVYYDQLLKLHYQNHNSEFFRKNGRQQYRFLTHVTDKINESLPAPQNGIKSVCSQVEVPYVYHRVHDVTGSKWQRVISADNENILMAGNIEGIGILDMSELDIHKPLRSKDQLVDPDSGICLILQVEECSIPDIFNSQPVYVPIRSAKTVEILSV